MIKINCMEASNGDAILISADGKNILIDGGYKSTYENSIVEELKTIAEKGEYLDLVILTHFDADHVVGLTALLKDETYSSLVKEVWFNKFSELDKHLYDASFESSHTQGINFEDAVTSLRQRNPKLIVRSHVDSKILSQNISLSKELALTVMSPTPLTLQSLAENYKDELNKTQNFNSSGGIDDTFFEFSELWDNPDSPDTSVTNGSSIAVMLTYKSGQYLFLGDAHINVISDALRAKGRTKNNKENISFIKLSHHGSKFNISKEFLELVTCKNYYISTRRRSHKETIAKIIKHQGDGVKVMSNYSKPVDEIKSVGDYKLYGLFLEKQGVFYGN